jgi:2-C-methyl-D-erythritol 2,4-cyclodiphosphate synthase
LVSGRPLWLGGVEIAHDRGLEGHSDADVLLHAVTDALLGAAGLGDIGQWFPDDDPANRGRRSSEMLAVVFGEVRRKGWRPVNVELRESLARLLELPTDAVNVKAKTGESVGPIGREEAISAEAVVLLEFVGPAAEDARPLKV